MRDSSICNNTRSKKELQTALEFNLNRIKILFTIQRVFYIAEVKELWMFTII